MGRRIRTLYIAGLFIFAAIIFVTLTTCDPMDIRGMIEELVGGSGEVEIDTVPPNVDAGTYPEYYANGSPLFGGANDPNGGTITATWSEVTDKGVTFGDANALDSTITYDGWTNGAVVVEVTLNLLVTDGTNEVNAEVTITLYNTDYVYVTTAGTGDGSEPGKPLSDIPTAISYASTNGKTAVAVAEGTYSYASTGTTCITLVEGISLYGGYSSNPWDRDPESNTTTIKDINANGGKVIESPSGITNNTVVDGFTLQASSGGGSSSFTIDIKANSSPTIRNTIIKAGIATAAGCYGIYVESPSSAMIDNNDIQWQGTTSTGATYGIRCNGSSASPTIKNNTINGGRGTSDSFGINVYAGKPLIEANAITAGGGGSSWSRGIYLNECTSALQIRNNTINGSSGVNNQYGIYLEASSVIIRNNTIDCGSDSSAGNKYGIYLTSDSDPTIQNNIIYQSGSTTGSCVGIVESDGNSDPVAVDNNNVYNCPAALYHDDDIEMAQGVPNGSLNDVLIAGDIGNFYRNGTAFELSTPTGQNNIDTNPSLAGTDGYHLTAGSTTKAKTGGLDGGPNGNSWGFTTDKDGNTRTGNGTDGWSMGAYELD